MDSAHIGHVLDPRSSVLKAKLCVLMHCQTFLQDTTVTTLGPIVLLHRELDKCLPL